LRVSGSGMKSRHASAPVPPEPLKPVRHEKIERMNSEQHALLDRVLRHFKSSQGNRRVGGVLICCSVEPAARNRRTAPTLQQPN